MTHIQIPLRHQKRADYRGGEDQPRFVSYPVQRPRWERNRLLYKAQLTDAAVKPHRAGTSGHFQQQGPRRVFLEGAFLFVLPLARRVEETRDEFSGEEDTSKKDLLKVSFVSLLQYDTGALLYIFNRCFT